MNKKFKIIVLKLIASLLITFGLVCSWYGLNYTSTGNITGIGLGDFILMSIGAYSLGKMLHNVIWK